MPWQITTAMWQANHGLPPVIWWNNLEPIMAAVHDPGGLARPERALGR